MYEYYNRTRLKDHTTWNATAYVHVKNKKVVSVGLQSYRTMVIRVKDDRMVVSGLYSMTTRRHIGWYLKEYYPWLSYYDIKDMYKKDMALDLNTKELVPLTDEEQEFVDNEYYGARI